LLAGELFFHGLVLRFLRLILFIEFNELGFLFVASFLTFMDAFDASLYASPPFLEFL
jgi:hypothetical protein